MNYEILTADQKTQELLGTFAGRMTPMFHATKQTSEEVAEIVQSIILSEQPNFRYQTNDKYRPQVEAKLADPTGNALLEMMNKTWLDDK